MRGAAAVYPETFQAGLASEIRVLAVVASLRHGWRQACCDYLLPQWV